MNNKINNKKIEYPVGIYKCKTCDLKHYEIVGEKIIQKECVMKKNQPNWMTCIITE